MARKGEVSFLGRAPKTTERFDGFDLPWNSILGLQVVNVSVPEEKVGDFAKALLG